MNQAHKTNTIQKPLSRGLGFKTSCEPSV